MEESQTMVQGGQWTLAVELETCAICGCVKGPREVAGSRDTIVQHEYKYPPLRLTPQHLHLTTM